MAPVAMLLLAGACARQGAPAGGPSDGTPPAVVAVTPEMGVTLEEMPETLVFLFSERISERPSNGLIDDAVEISPMTGEARVRHRRDRLEVSLDGGFQPGLVYRITVLPVIQDMFSNSMRAPFELVFSTGGVMDPTAVAGTVVDRITLRTQDPTRVNAVLMDGQGAAAHTALADTGSVFALRYLPPGLYRVTAFQDVNRDRVPDPFESQSTVTANISESDTVFLNFRTLIPDTTAAILARVEMNDSARLTLAFDDFMDPEWEPTLVRVAVSDSVILDSLGAPIPEADSVLPDSIRTAPLPRVEVILHPFQVDDFMRARRDSISRILRARSLEEAMESGDTLAIAAARAAIDAAMSALTAAAEEEPRPREEPLPVQEMVAVLDGPLPPGAYLRVDVEGVRNISGLSGGAGTVGMLVPVPAPPDSAAADSLAADSLATDSAGVVLPPSEVEVADSLQADTIAADTLRPATIPADTIRPDTVSVDAVPADPIPADTIRPDTLLAGRRSQASVPPGMTRAVRMRIR